MAKIPTQEDFERAQTELNPREDLAPYRGRWVALRDGYVVASDLSLTSLRAQPGLRETDVFMPVSRHPSGIFIA